MAASRVSKCTESDDPRSGSSSSSSSEDELERLREATWSFKTSDSSAGKNSDDGASSAGRSCGKRKEAEENTVNELQTTPEFRCHVAKKLGAMLDSCIVVTSNAVKQTPLQRPASDEGFRLFSTSVSEDIKVASHPQEARRRPAVSSSDSEGELESRLIEAAVSGQDILKHSVIERQRATTNGGDATASESKKKKKKKKKKKQRQEEIGAGIHMCGKEDEWATMENCYYSADTFHQRDVTSDRQNPKMKSKKKKLKTVQQEHVDL
ncbi:protein CUSTOS [Polypterus senegalus]|uniref:protein CUSTOS n=1 Tax=Polypterus senegalus TaxID=55291 RepID=UPI001964E53F|nr:protein CUSTOS [Polypterus senegalus]